MLALDMVMRSTGDNGLSANTMQAEAQKVLASWSLPSWCFWKPSQPPHEDIRTGLLDNERHVAYLPCHHGQQPANHHTRKRGQSRCAAPGLPINRLHICEERAQLKSADSGLDQQNQLIPTPWTEIDDYCFNLPGLNNLLLSDTKLIHTHKIK